MKIIAFIHAKGNSTRVQGKNLKILGDKPLFCHNITNALKSQKITNVIIDSDSEEILNIGKDYGATPLKRDVSLASNQTTGDDLAFWEASQYPDSDITVHVVPTSPFLQPSSIDAAIDLLIDKKVNTVVGVFQEPLYQWKDGKPAYFDINGRIPNSFELEPVIYETTGLYVNKTISILQLHKRIDINSCLPYYLSRIESIDINTPEDFDFAEIVWQGLQKN